MSEETPSSLLIGRIETGYVILVAGRGTCRESAAVQQFATETYRVENCSMIIDLSQCEHLDSTFLGCLVNLHKRFGAGHPSRFVVVASPEKVQKLLAPSRLDSFLEITDQAPDLSGTLLILSETKLEQFEMGRHVMECHRILADLGGPHAAAFAAVADRLEQELAERKPAAEQVASG